RPTTSSSPAPPPTTCCKPPTTSCAWRAIPCGPGTPAPTRTPAGCRSPAPTRAYASLPPRSDSMHGRPAAETSGLAAPARPARRAQPADGPCPSRHARACAMLATSPAMEPGVDGPAVRVARNRPGLGAGRAAAVAPHTLGRRAPAVAGRPPGAGGRGLRRAGHRQHAAAPGPVAVAVERPGAAPPVRGGHAGHAAHRLAPAQPRGERVPRPRHRLDAAGAVRGLDARPGVLGRHRRTAPTDPQAARGLTLRALSPDQPATRNLRTCSTSARSLVG